MRPGNTISKISASNFLVLQFSRRNFFKFLQESFFVGFENVNQIKTTPSHQLKPVIQKLLSKDIYKREGKNMKKSEFKLLNLLWDETEEAFTGEKDHGKPRKLLKVQDVHGGRDTKGQKIVLGFTTEDFLRQQKYKAVGERLPMISETFSSL
jgi:hypothetical protein